jgi:hypothetical protein
MPKTERIYQVDKIRIENGEAFTVVDEDYGYSVRPGRQARRRATLVEWAAQYLGFLSLFAMIGVVVSAGGLSGSKVDVFELGIMFLGLAAAGGFFYIGTRGTAVELQVDTARRELRTAIRNWKGSTRILEVHAMANIESAFVRARGFPLSHGQFLVRTQKDPSGVVLLSGDPDGLHHLHEVLSRPVVDWQKQKARVASRPITFSGKVRATA